MSNQITGLLAELERLTESGESCYAMKTADLTQDERKAAHLMQKMMSRHRAALEYDLIKYKLASDALGIGFWNIDFVDGDLANPNNRFTVSDECRKMLGFSNDVDLPNHMSSLTSQLRPDEKDWILEAVAMHVNDRTGQTPYDHEYHIRTKSGEYRYFHVFGSTMRDQEGNPLRLAAAMKDITDRKMVEEKAREAEERVQLLLDATPLCINFWDENLRNILTNDEAVKLFDLSSKQEYFDRFGELSPEYQPCGERTNIKGPKIVREAFEKGYCQTEWMHIKLDGEPLPCEVTHIRVKYRDGYAVAGYTRDLREEKKMLARLREEQERNEAMALKQLEAEEARKAIDIMTNILSGLDALIYVTDPRTGEILFINKQMREYYGVDKNCVGKACFKVFRNLDEQCAECPCRELDKEPDKVLIREEPGLDLKSTIRHTERYIKWPDGRLVHLRHSVDITDLKNVTNALDERLKQQDLMTFISQSFLLHIKSPEKFNELVTESFNRIGEFMGAALILLYVLDEEERQFTCTHDWAAPHIKMPSVKGMKFSYNQSRAAVRLFDRMRNREAHYMTSDEPIVREVMGPYRSLFQNYMCTTIFVDDKLYGMLDFSWENNGQKWNQDDINMAEFFCNVLTSVFRRQKVAEQLISAKVMAEEGNRSKSIFLASMSHEIRTPLNAILGIAEIELLEPDLSPKLEESFSKIYESGDLLLNIINDILDHSKIEAGKLEVLPVKYDMPSLLNDTIQLVRLRYESKPLFFKLEIDENTPLDLIGDELRIKQVLNNLLSNAFKYTSEGGVSLSVSGTPEPSDETDGDVTLVFRISDTGQGMSEEQMARLFDEYTRFNLQTNRSIGGTGLGMNITKRFVELMDGEISVESKPGKGTVFTVKLPQKYIGRAVCGSELAEKLECSHSESIKKTRKTQIAREYMPYGSVLIVDDVESNLYVAKGLLAPYGLKIETADSGMKAIEVVKSGKNYDIIFMDHMMPEMDGIEATKIIRDMDYKGFIVALTANAVAGQAEIFLANGFDRFLSKPIDLREMNVILNELIRAKQPAEVVKSAREKKKDLIKPSGEMEKAFLRDAEKAIALLDDLYERLAAGDEADIKSYIISVHGIKNALYNIGEKELSDTAQELEQAGRNSDMAKLADETPAFLGNLRALILKIKAAEPPDSAAKETDEVNEDKKYLYEKMAEIMAACTVYDKKAIKAVMEELRKKPWSLKTLEMLDEIDVHLLHSAFRKVDDAAGELLRQGEWGM